MSGIKNTMQCDHCGKKAVFEVRGEGTKYGAVLDDRYKDGQDITSWRILECQWCMKPTLEEVKTSYEFQMDDVYGGMKAVSFEITILYPGMKAPLANLPKTIEKRYLAALKVQDAEPSAFAVLIGKTLEAVCNHEGVTGKMLGEKLHNLIDSERIPPTLAQMARQINQIRNLGAHDKEDDVTEEDVPIIRDFVEAILEYLYVAPAKIDAIQASLKTTSEASRRL